VKPDTPDGSEREAGGRSSDDFALSGRVYAIPFQRVWTEAVHLIDGRGPRWVLLDANDEVGVIRARANVPILRSVADVEIRIGLDSDAQTRVAMESRSRGGRWWERGVNTRRVRRFLEALDRSLGAATPRSTRSPPAAPSLADPSSEPDRS
jgi:uncharacterized protein (DUF1499 family)